MCQTSALIEKDGGQELLLENITNLEVLSDSLEITTLFEGTKSWSGLAIRRIDFSAGKVYLYKMP
ncbi:MAG: CooT family nickel-binding protein [Proteobacteria bacterium]|nr:CooT family nickel-binding protein [Pseudomonadota bacterium]